MELETLDVLELCQLYGLAQERCDTAYAAFKAAVRAQNRTAMDQYADELSDYLRALNDVQKEIARRGKAHD